MPQSPSRRLATEQYVTDGLATKVNSSTYTTGLAGKQDAATLGADVAADPTVRAAYARPTSTDGTNSLPAPTGVGLEFVITATGLQDIRFNGSSL